MILRGLTLALLFVVGLRAQATTAVEFVQNFSQLSNLQRAAQSFEICDQLFARWPGDAYFQEVQTLGQLWQTSPEASYLVLSTCQTMWISRYLDPIKSASAANHANRAKLAYYISALDFISSYKYLREEIRLFTTIQPKTSAQTPPSPYELLIGLASSDRQMDEALHFEMKTAVSALAATGGTLITALKATKAFTDFTVTRSVQAGRIAKHAALITVIAWGAGELVSYNMWQARHSDLIGQVRAIGQRLADPRNETLRPILLDEFYRATERLGYFYSYDLYMAESGANVKANSANQKCHDQLGGFFGAQVLNFENTLFSPTSCRDAAMVWIGASQFLKRILPGQPEAQLIGDRLLARAKRTYWRYEETRAYEKTLPVCGPDLGNSTIFKINYECRDPVTGGLVI